MLLIQYSVRFFDMILLEYSSVRSHENISNRASVQGGIYRISLFMMLSTPFCCVALDLVEARYFSKQLVRHNDVKKPNCSWTQMSDQTQWNDLIAIPSTVPKALMLERRDTKLQMDGKSLTYGCISKSNLYLRIWWCKFLTAQERTILWAQFSYSDRFLTVNFEWTLLLRF